MKYFWPRKFQGALSSCRMSISIDWYSRKEKSENVSKYGQAHLDMLKFPLNCNRRLKIECWIGYFKRRRMNWNDFFISSTFLANKMAAISLEKLSLYYFGLWQSGREKWKKSRFLTICGWCHWEMHLRPNYTAPLKK